MKARCASPLPTAEYLHGHSTEWCTPQAYIVMRALNAVRALVADMTIVSGAEQNLSPKKTWAGKPEGQSLRTCRQLP